MNMLKMCIGNVCEKCGGVNMLNVSSSVSFVGACCWYARAHKNITACAHPSMCMYTFLQLSHVRISQMCNALDW